MLKFIARLFASKPVVREPLSNLTQWILVKRAAEKSGNPDRLAAMRVAAQKGYELMVEKYGRDSMLHPTYEGYQAYGGFCLSALHDTAHAKLRPEARKPITVVLTEKTPSGRLPKRSRA